MVSFMGQTADIHSSARSHQAATYGRKGMAKEKDDDKEEKASFGKNKGNNMSEYSMFFTTAGHCNR